MYLGDKIRRRKRIVDLFNQQSGACYYCGKAMTLDLGYQNTATLDHLVPRSKGGPTKDWNLVAACHWDNQQKGSMSAERYFKNLRELSGVLDGIKMSAA
jgi:5-methylcytosine-specific restriction endonuclease McrA